MTTILEKPTNKDTALSVIGEEASNDTETITITDIVEKIIMLEKVEETTHRTMQWCAHFFHDFLKIARANDILGDNFYDTYLDLLDDFQRLYQKYIHILTKNRCELSIENKSFDKKFITYLDDKIKDFITIEESTNSLQIKIKDDVYDLAERKDYCRVYDDFAEEWGLPTLPRDRTITATITLSVYCSYMDEHEARQELIERIDEVDISDIEITLDD